MERFARLCACFVVALVDPGCRAAPPPGEFPPAEGGGPEAAAEADPVSWTDRVDAAVFGAGASARRPAARAAGSDASDLPDPGSLPADARRRLEAAARRVGEDRLDEAVVELDAAAAALGPGQRWVALRALGDVLMALRREREAAAAYREALEGCAEGAAPDLRSNLAAAWLRLGDADAARADAERALTLRPDHPGALKTLGLLDLREGRPDEGRARLVKALGSGADIPEAEVALAELDEREGDGAAALSRYARLEARLAERVAEDHHRRWKDLFYPGTRTTAEELRSRIERLERAVRGGLEPSVEAPGVAGRTEKERDHE